MVIGGTAGPALVAYSGQNIDRLVSVYKAARRTERQLVVDLYTWAIARATGRSSIPQVGFEGFRVYVPKHHRVLIKERGAFDLGDEIKPCRIYDEELVDRASGLVLTYRGAIQGILERHPAALKGAVLVWSLWRGYLDRDERAREFCQRHQFPFSKATPRDTPPSRTSSDWPPP